MRLHWPPVTVPALLAGAGGPRSLRLSGQIADGTILTGGTSPDGAQQARRHIDEGRLAAGRSDSHSITVYVMAATGPGAAQRLEAEQHSSVIGGGNPVFQGRAEALPGRVASHLVVGGHR